MGNKITDNKSGQPFPQYERTFLSNTLMVLYAFGIYWVLIFINNFNDYIATAVSLNYFFSDYEAKKIKNINILCHVLADNIGTIAWSIVILPVMIIKFPFAFLNDWLSKNKGKCAQIVNKIFCPCCWLFENFIDRIDEGYFVVSYLDS